MLHGRNIPVLEIDWAEEDPAGTFRILGDLSAASEVNGGFASPDDVALVPAHIRHHIPAQDRPLNQSKYLRLRWKYSRNFAAYT